ncbi:hypothetical protein JZO86_06060 [Enterococcus ureasiticus]|uniref:hypothetical protein n=1 Tax=Enterococcus ureasiticus TaxID=903984 RepID=UPI001A8BF7CA|nr:hypothetical protein [Enterococcus ureasiticus]MBO0473264.1 hypothetical protein [Enterococcus ureasiticus]
MKLKELLSVFNDETTAYFEIEEEIYPKRMLVKDIKEVYPHALDYKVTTVDAAVSYIHCSDGEPVMYIVVTNGQEESQ